MTFNTFLFSFGPVLLAARQWDRLAACGREVGPGQGRSDRLEPCYSCEEGGVARRERAEPKGSARTFFVRAIVSFTAKLA